MEDQAKQQIEPSKSEQRENRQREVLGFNVGLIIMALVVVVAIVVGAILVI